jgi:hypothetical protein
MPTFWSPMLARSPEATSVERWGWLPILGFKVMVFTTMAPRRFRSMKEAYSSAYPKVPEAGMTGFFNWRCPMLTEQSGKPLIPVDLPDVIDRTILANQRVTRVPVFRPLESGFFPAGGFLDGSGTEGNRTRKAGSEAAAHVGLQGDLALETEAFGEGGQFHEHGSRAACVERARLRHFPCFEEMKKKFRRSSTKAKAPVVRVEIEVSKALEFLLVEDSIFEPGAHENVKARRRSEGPHSLCHRTEGGDSNASCRQHNVRASLYEKAVAQRADEIQGFPFLSGREPFGSLAYDPVKDLEARNSILFSETMHAERTSQKGVHRVRAPEVVKLARDRGMAIIGEIESQKVTVLSNLLVLCDRILHVFASASHFDGKSAASAGPLSFFLLPCIFRLAPCTVHCGPSFYTL